MYIILTPVTKWILRNNMNDLVIYHYLRNINIII